MNTNFCLKFENYATLPFFPIFVHPFTLFGLPYYAFRVNTNNECNISHEQKWQNQMLQNQGCYKYIIINLIRC
jgi:hypothetical protein